ncbi:serine phosphatase RsbU (regulator of sigma subunit) [Actinomadura pelletieri DSM 43383]|uniref:Serine phosphatase RsbU (Regulator of sigma subunit) n=1 Tax=Actinomadura pelletieri DSM 43383 TaxID=1120940 RepID=A0A495R070_9ACTN|nr:fused response regulator/phosphatase [Actinomadura pelletieri]RKS79727.1 serine phosphatase RsbU (regulator of sigma subunit) [Actinomadura pelletieri DSM 43383]
MTAMHSRGAERLLGVAGSPHLLLVEDDPGDAFLFEELLSEAQPDVRITVATTLAEALDALRPDIQCVIVDLALPDAQGLDALRQVRGHAPDTAVLVLTGLADAHVGVEAVAAGAQDYLVKQDVDGALLTRAISYAIERKRADESERQLVEARALSRENARLERGLLPVPILNDTTLRHHTRYRPGRYRALLGGDFHDTVETSDGAVHVVIGDVSGHGADEASLGVRLRMAWRTLILAGHTGERLLDTLDAVLQHERWAEEIFTTVCMLTIAPDRRTARLHRAGHPRPLFFGPDGVVAVPDEPRGPALGLIPSVQWPFLDLELGDSWGLLLYTDGLIEGHVGDGYLDLSGLMELATTAHGAGQRGDVLVDGLIAEAERLNGDVLSDDLAVLLLSRGDG